MRNMNSNLEESDVTNPSPPSTAEAEDEDSDGDELNSSIEALDWDDIDAELAETEDFANVMANLKKSMSSLHSEPRAEAEGSTEGTADELDGEPRPRKLVAVMRMRTGASVSSEDVPKEIDAVDSIEEMASVPVVPPTILPDDERPESDYGSGDVTSNAPVLDDGPIWSKGSKKYRFVENRRMNKFLTFGVILSVVLAIGIGVGNLLAVNECEEELKVASRPPQCSCSGKNPFQDQQPIAPFGAASFATNHDIFESSSASHFPKSRQFKVDASGNEEILPFMPPSQPDFPTAAEQAKWSEGSQYQTPVDQSQKISQIIKILGDLALQLERYENITRADEIADKDFQRVRIELGLTDDPESIRYREMYDEMLRNPYKFVVKEDVYDPLEQDDDEISLELDTTDSNEPIVVPSPAPEPAKEAHSPNPSDPASKKRNKFRTNKNPEDKLHKTREPRQTPKGEYDSDSSNDAFHKIQKRNRDAFQEDRDKSYKPKKPKHEKYDDNLPSKLKNSKKYCNKDEDIDFKKNTKVKKVKHHKKHDAQPQIYPEWQSVRAKVRKEARQQREEQKQQAVKNWYFARAKGREKSRH